MSKLKDIRDEIIKNEKALEELNKKKIEIDKKIEEARKNEVDLGGLENKEKQIAEKISQLSLAKTSNQKLEKGNDILTKDLKKARETEESQLKELQQKEKILEELKKEKLEIINTISTQGLSFILKIKIKSINNKLDKTQNTINVLQQKVQDAQLSIKNLESKKLDTSNNISPLLKDNIVPKDIEKQINNLSQELGKTRDLIKKGKENKKIIKNLSKEKTINNLALSEAEIKRMELPQSIEKRFEALSKKSKELSELITPNKKQKKELELIKKELEEDGKFDLKQKENQTKQENKQNMKFENAKDVIVNTLDSFLGEKNNKETLEKIIVGVGENKKGAVLGQASKLVGKNLFKLLKLATYIPYLKKEGEKIPKILKGETKYNPKKPPFFLTLIQDKALPGVITKNKQNLLDLGQKVMEIPFASKLLTPLGIDSKLLNKVGPNAIDLASSAIPLAGKIAQNLIKSPEDLAGIYNNLKEKNISNVIHQGSNIIKNLAPVLSNDLPGFINQNKDNLLGIAMESLAIKPIADIVTPLGITPELVGNVLPKALDIASSALPLVNNVAQNLANSKDELSGAYKDFVEFGKEGGDKDQAISGMLENGSKIVQNLAPVLDKDLPGFINQNKDNLVHIAKESLAIEPIKKIVEPLGITSELVGNVMPNVLDIASSSLPFVNKVAQNLAQSPKELSELYKDFQEKNVSGLIENGSKIIQNLSPVLDKDLPGFIHQNKKNLLGIAMESLAIKPIADIVTPLGITPELVGKVLPTVLDIASSSLPLVNKVAQNLAKSQHELFGAFHNFTEFQKQNEVLLKVDQSPADIEIATEKQQMAISGLIENGSKIIQNLAPVLDKDLPGFIHQNKKNLLGIAMESLAIKPIADIVTPLGITPELVEKAGSDVLDIASSALPLANKVAQSLANSKDELAGAYKDFVEFGKEGGNKDKAISGMLANGAKIMEKITPVLDTDLPKFLIQNKNVIGNIVSNVIEQPVFAKTLEQLGIPPELVKEATSEGINLIAPMLPIITKLANGALKDQKGLKSIITQVQETIAAPEEEQEKHALKLVGSILAFKDKNPEVKEAIEKDIPKLLEQNAATLGPVVDKFLNQTPVGKNLRIKGEDILKVAAKKMPQLVEAADLFTKKQYGKLIPKALKILFDKDVMKLAVTAAIDVIKLKYNEKTRWNSTRRTLAGTEVNKSLSEALKKGGNIGATIEGLGKEAKGKTAKYSMVNRDFHGLHFDKQELKFDKCKLENFNFKDAKFGKASFKDTEIINCNFDKVEFKEKIDFTGMKIDKKSFESLMPAIKRYNDKHPDPKDKMVFENITVVSNDKKLELSKAVEKIKGNISKHVVTGKDTGARNIAQTTDKSRTI